MSKPVEGQRYGCYDMMPPQAYTAYQLSRLLDALNSAEEAGLDKQKVFMMAPDSMKSEFNYSCWEYKAAK